MVYTKEDFKRAWDSEDCHITWDEIADCAKSWGLYSNPRCEDLYKVRYRVCEAAGVRDMPFNPFKKKEKKTHTITEDFAWQVYNIIVEWKAGKFGERPLQEVLDEKL